VARNPKDVMVSFYYHHKLVVKFHNFTGDFPLFARYFMDNMGMIYYRNLNIFLSNVMHE